MDLSDFLSRFEGPLAQLIRSFIPAATPDPWPHEIDLAVRSPEAIPLCISCLFPQEGRPWFCPHCGFPAGEFVAAMPYLHIFPTGEILRRGVMGSPDTGFLPATGFAFLSATQYGPFVPVYWFWMARKALGKPICQLRRVDLGFEDSPGEPGP